MYRKKIIYSLLAMLLPCIVSFGWVNPEYIAERFDEALLAYRAGEYGKAHQEFVGLIIDSRGSPYFAMSKFMIPMCSYKAENWSSATREFADFVNTLPEHECAPAALVYQGNSHYRIGEYIPAVKAFISAIDISEDRTETAAIAEESARRILWGYLGLNELEVIGEQVEGVSGQLVDYIRVKRHLEIGEKARALEICQRSLIKRPKGAYTDSLKNISRRISKELSEHIAVAVFAPTAGVYTEYGTSMVNGIRLAISEYEKSSGQSIEIVVENTAADPLVGAYAAKRLIGGHSPVVAFGPLLSDVAVPIATLCDQYRVPLISPTASKDGIAGLSPFVFQVATPPSLGSEKLAEYAVNTLGITRFSILSPDDPAGRKAAANFADRVEKLGAETVSIAYYAEGTVDFSEHLRSIKKPFFEEMKNYSARADTTDLRFYKPNGVFRDENEWIVTIPGLFLPAYYEDLVNILPQIPFNYIETRLLGANGWIIDEIRSMDGSYIDSAVVVPDDFWTNTETPGWESFSKSYRRAYGYTPDRIAALGYVSGEIVCKAFASGLVTSDQIRDYLSAITDFEGPGGEVSFDATGTNTEVNLVIFDRNIPKRIKQKE